MTLYTCSKSYCACLINACYFKGLPSFKRKHAPFFPHWIPCFIWKCCRIKTWVLFHVNFNICLSMRVYVCGRVHMCDRSYQPFWSSDCTLGFTDSQHCLDFFRLKHFALMKLSGSQTILLVNPLRCKIPPEILSWYFSNLNTFLYSNVG